MPILSLPARSVCGPVTVPRAVTLVRVALDRQLAVDLELAVLADGDGVGGEAELGEALGVEELGAAQMRGEVLVLDDDRIGLDRALQPRLAILADGERAVVVVELRAEGGDDHVLDGEADVRVHLVDRPVAGCQWLCRCRAHR